VLVSYLFDKIIIRLEKQAEKSVNLWDDTLLHAAKRPLALLIWLVGLSWAAHIAQIYSGA